MQRYLVFKKESLPGIQLHNACNGPSKPRFPADTACKFVWGIYELKWVSESNFTCDVTGILGRMVMPCVNLEHRCLK